MLHRKWKSEPDSFALFMKTAATLYCGINESDALDPNDFAEPEEN